MNKRDAVKAMCDGYKVRHSDYCVTSFIVIDGAGYFRNADGTLFDTNRMRNDDGWSIHTEIEHKKITLYPSLCRDKYGYYTSWRLFETEKQAKAEYSGNFIKLLIDEGKEITV